MKEALIRYSRITKHLFKYLMTKDIIHWYEVQHYWYMKTFLKRDIYHQWKIIMMRCPDRHYAFYEIFDWMKKNYKSPDTLPNI